MTVTQVKPGLSLPGAQLGAIAVYQTADGRRVGRLRGIEKPETFHLTPDEKELWVSADLSGLVDIIDTRTHRVIGDIVFQPTGFRRNEVTPVDLVMTGDGATAFVALGRANHVASRRVESNILVGKRPWGLALSADEKMLFVANNLSDDISIVDVERRRVLKSVPLGQVPYAILLDE